MPLRIQTQLAQQIVDTLKTICSHDINFIDVGGRIAASTDPARWAVITTAAARRRSWDMW